MTRYLILGIYLATAGASSAAESLNVHLATEALVKQRLESGLVAMTGRQAKIRELFADAGCAAEEQKVDKHFSNVICTLPGETLSTIVIGGHFDFGDRGTGILDDWSGTALLPSLYEALKGLPRKHTYVFVAFAAEERGLVGSTLFVKKLGKDRRAEMQAFVNLECLGLAPPNVWMRRSTPALAARFLEVAANSKVPVSGVNMDKVADDDTHPFVGAKIPVLSIHSLTQDTWKILRTAEDRLEMIRMKDYFQTYRLVAFYLAYLDLKLQ